MSEIAKGLLEIKAVFLSPDEPFTWASGIKSPIYCDNRLTLGYPVLRDQIAKGLSSQIKAQYPDVELIMGTATAGIAHAALTANQLVLPMGYVRSSSKAHGRNNQIEGAYQKGQKVVVVEDLISTGGSSLDVVDCLKEVGLDVLGVVAIFSYELDKGVSNFRHANVSYHALVTYEQLIGVALNMKYVNASQLLKLKAWRSNPSDASWMNL